MVGLALWLASGTARGQTANLQVVATVEASCTLTGGTLNFGTLQSEEGATSETTISYTCPAGMRIGLTMNQGRQPEGEQRAMLRAGGQDTLRYQLFQDSSRSEVWGDQGDTLIIPETGEGGTSVDVYGAIGSGQSVPPGTYRDTVLITLVVDP